MLFKVNDQIQLTSKSDKGQYYQCICTDKRTACFMRIIKKKECFSVTSKGMFAASNYNSDKNSISHIRVKIKQWDGKSLKQFIPIKNAIQPSLLDQGTLTVYTKMGKIIFKKGQYIKSTNGIISKP